MIGIISRTEGEGSGAEIMLCHLLNNWQDNASLIVITARNSSVSQVAVANNIQVVELSFTPEKIWPNVKAVESSLRLLKSVSLIHAWNSKSFELGWYFAKRLRVPLTCTMHGHPRSSYFTAKKLWLLKAIANSSSGLIAVSGVLAEACRAQGYKCAITTIHNGLPGDEEGGNGEKENRGIHIGFLGMNAAGKGFPMVAEWIRETASEKNITWHLYGTIYKEYEPMLSQLKADGITNFINWGRQQPKMIFKNIHILVHASTIFDCYPTVLLEAARAGIPSVASFKGGAPEIVNHGLTGFLFDPLQPKFGLAHLKALMNDKALYAAMSQNAKAHFVQHLKINGMMAKYKQFWMQAITSKQTKLEQVV